MGVIVAAFARCVGDNVSGALLDIPEVPLDILDAEFKPNREYLDQLESLHKALVLYLWLSYRFAGVFINQAMAFHVKTLVEEKIDMMLAEYSSSPEISNRIKKMREEALRQISKLNEPIARSEDSTVRTEMVGAPTLPEDTHEQALGFDPEDARLVKEL